MEILFLHGLESGPHGRKFRALVEAGHQVEAPDMRGRNLAERVQMAVPLLRDGLTVVGSSYGGITAVLAAMESPARLRRLVLCAPALARNEEPNPGLDRLSVSVQTIIVHGTQDDIVPIGDSERFARAYPELVKLVVVDDGHRLQGSLETIVRAVSVPWESIPDVLSDSTG